jgi:phosphatidylglycerol---prolipoprotein diacylglyceryl transferase
MLFAIPWNVSPELFSIGPLHIRWYGLLFAMAFLSSFFVSSWMFKREGKSEEDLNKLFLYILAAVVVGARLGHCLFYDPKYYFANPIEILKVWEGGLASHGAAFGILLALILYARTTPSMSFLWVTDRVAVVIPLSALFVRLGNTMNSEILGKPADVPWAFIFQRVDQIPRHPVQLYEATCYLILFFVMLALYRQGNAMRKPAFLSGIFLVAMFTTRFILEFFKEGQSIYDPAMPLTMGQLLSIPLVLLGLFFIMRRKKTAVT